MRITFFVVLFAASTFLSPPVRAQRDPGPPDPNLADQEPDPDHDIVDEGPEPDGIDPLPDTWGQPGATTQDPDPRVDRVPSVAPVARQAPASPTPLARSGPTVVPPHVHPEAAGNPASGGSTGLLLLAALAGMIGVGVGAAIERRRR